ncbi:hypothetical protein RA086_13400 [Lactiplantibacillus sp. WILCCON 0030]|uniref:Uncharacterized protein n=1 Tax=Lactiplantibacillus brownii TaxID=3069269 RepID=A0ABU1ACC5_9LACO|nr:hypothetical protein [Lactiplantibacillus brownii]MDQ7938604.1 hypothetical protein [Lactiplantibacillus brownii]
MSISEIIIWTFVFILATGFITVISTAVLMRRAKNRPTDEFKGTPKEDDWDKDSWAHDDWKKGHWDDK